MSSVASGIFDHFLDGGLILLGAGIGVVLIIIDETLKRTTRFSLPPLAVGMGMYLPVALTVIIPVGAFLGVFYDKWADKQANPEGAKRMGTLLATGLIVGESLFGVVNAAIIAAAQGENPLEIFEGGRSANILGVVLFVAAVVFVYRATRKSATGSAPESARESAQN